MTLEQTLISMQNQKCNVRIVFEGGYHYSDPTWSVNISKDSKEVSCSISVRDEMVSEAIKQAWSKYQKAVKHGMPELQLAIEHKTEEEETF